MELRAYWRILWRRLWVVVGLTLAAGVLSYFLSPQAQAGYQSSFRLVVSLSPEPKTGNYFTYDQYYNWVAAEYLVDDLSEVVKSQAFMEEVRQEMGPEAARGVSVQSAFRAQKVHRILTVTVSAPTAEIAQALGSAAVQVLESRGQVYLAQLQSASVKVQMIDPPTLSTTASGRSYLDLGLRTGLGFLVGMVLAFFLHYLDDRVYERDEVERLLGVAVLGEIPPRAG